MNARVIGSKCDYGPVFWIRFAAWAEARRRILDNPLRIESMQLIQDSFHVSRATAYRWLAAWHEVHPTITGETR